MEASPAPSTSQNQQRQVAPATGPQIRSRITVVCAECKRLKLKCDRRSPCGSCTKRDTVARCIYSPAAAEKVDLHSLNNRLIQVEALLASFLGQGTSPFPSTNPLIPPSLGNASSAPLTGNFSSLATQHVHHHHSSASALSSDSISLTPQDLASIWLDDLGAALPVSPAEGAHQARFSNEEHSGQIKLEPVLLDVEFSRLNDGASSNIIDVDQTQPSVYPTYDSHSSTPLRRESVNTPSRPIPHILLPALSIYYPVPTISPPGTSASSSAAFPSRPAVNSGLSSSLSTPSTNNGLGLAPATSAPPQYARPQVTSALLQLLPPVSVCKQYLENAYDVAFSVRPVPFQHGWDEFKTRSLALLTDDGELKLEREMKRERREKEKEKAREARLARKVYFSGIHGLQDADMDDAETSTSGAGLSRTARSAAAVEITEDEHSLPFFAAMCNVLAVGAFVTSSSASVSDAAQDAPSFLHALAQQALGVWDTAQAGATQPQHESEKLDYVLACLLGCGYLVLSTAAKRRLYGEDDPKDSSGSSYASPGFETPTVALVGKLVKAARALDLGGETISGIRRSGIALSVNTDGNNSGKQTRKEKEAEKERLKEEWKRAIWWEVMWYDLFTTDTLGHQAHIPLSMYASAQPPPCAAYPALAPPPALFILPCDDDHDDDEDYEDGEALEDGAQSHLTLSSTTRNTPPTTAPTLSAPEIVETAVQLRHAYLGARHRLIQLVHRVKSRLAQPDCCCGYTLDQAAALEDHVRQWQSALPVQLQHSSLEDFGQRQPPNTLAVDKVLLAQTCELAVIANLLVIRIYTPFLRKQTPTSHTAQATGTGPPSANPPALMATLHACQASIRAMSDLHSAFSSPEGRQAAHDHRKSEILPCLLDIYPPEKVVFDSVVICAHAVLTLKGGSSSFDITSLKESITAGLSLLGNAPLAASHRKIVDGLRTRIGGYEGGGLKRKFSQVDMLITPTVNYVPQSAANGTVDPEPWTTSSTQQPGVHENHDPSTTQQYHNAIIQLPPPSPVVAATPTSTAFPRNPEINHGGQGKQERPPPPVTVALPLKPSTAPAKTPTETGQKEKKAKKSAPVVGIRVRPGKQSDKQRPSTQQPLMTLAPRPMPSPEDVRLYKQKLQLHTGASKPPPEAAAPTSSTPIQERDTQHRDATMRSRSSSVSFQPTEHRPEAMNAYPPFFNQQTSTELSNNRGAQANNFPLVQQQLKQQVQVCAETPQGPFARSSYDQPQPMEYRNPAFENTPTTNGTSSSESMHFNSNVSSPFTNSGPPPSESSSPFTAGTVSSPGNPSTPAFTAHSSLPVFGPQLDMSLNSASYVQTQSPGPFDAHYGPISAPYGGQHQQVHTGISLSDVVMDQSMSVSPLYGNSQQQQHHPHQMQGAPFEMKPGIEHQSQIDVHSHHAMHQQHQQTVNEHRRGDADHDMSHQSHHGSMDMTLAGPWPGPNHPQMQENPSPLQHSYQWNNGGQYQFYH